MLCCGESANPALNTASEQRTDLLCLFGRGVESCVVSIMLLQRLKLPVNNELTYFASSEVGCRVLRCVENAAPAFKKHHVKSYLSYLPPEIGVQSAALCLYCCSSIENCL